MHKLRLIWRFIAASSQEEMAYRENFSIGLLHSLLNLATGVLGLTILFNQVTSIQGWTFAQTLALLGVYLTVGALRGLFIGPGMDALAGLGQEISTGNFDFVLLRPLNTQFLVTFRRWRLFSLLDLALGVGVLWSAVNQMPGPLPFSSLLAFLLALACAVSVLYSFLLAFTALVFWSPGFLFTWVFDAVFQMARYPVGIYPGWLRLILTWVIPVGVITTIPAQALTAQASPAALGGSLLAAAVLLFASSKFFQAGLRRYSSASS